MIHVNYSQICHTHAFTLHAWYVGRSINEVICHGIPDGRPLEDGDICNGWWFEFAFCCVMSVLFISTGTSMVGLLLTSTSCMHHAFAVDSWYNDLPWWLPRRLEWDVFRRKRRREESKTRQNDARMLAESHSIKYVKEKLNCIEYLCTYMYKHYSHVYNIRRMPFRFVRAVKPGMKYRDIGDVIQKHAQANGFSVVRTYCGHGIHR